jgi:dihydrofolate reductase
MGKLIYSMSVSLDGFVATPEGSLDWVKVDEELHTAFNDEAREVSAFLYGRRMWELMAGYWPTGDTDPTATPVEREFSTIWKSAPKIVFSRSLERVDHDARLVRDDVVAEVVRLKAQPDFDMGVGGPTITAPLLAAGLVDEIRAYVQPVVLGAGSPFLPPLDERIGLELVETRTFGSGVVWLRYVTSKPGA